MIKDQHRNDMPELNEGQTGSETKLGDESQEEKVDGGLRITIQRSYS